MLFMINKPNNLEDLYTLNEITCFLDKFVECGIIAGYNIADTKDYDLTTNSKYRNRNKDRSEWANKVVRALSNRQRAEIGKTDAYDEYDFSYIKLCKQIDTNNVYGLVHGSSQFHCFYPSDVEFYDLNNPPASKKKSGLYDFCKDNNLEWYTDVIIIVKNKDYKDYIEAISNERLLAKAFHTFD